MVNPQIFAQRQHLRDASLALSTTVPGISAHLMHRFLTFSAENDVSLSPSDKRIACMSCGTTRPPVAGGASIVEEEGRGKRKRGERSSGTPDLRNDDSFIATTSTRLYTCPACKRIMESDSDVEKRVVGTSKSATASNPTKASLSITQSTSHANEAQKDAAGGKPKAGNRSRKKGRKDKPLSSLLAAEKGRNSGDSHGGGGFGLDILDFMKTV